MVISGRERLGNILIYAVAILQQQHASAKTFLSLPCPSVLTCMLQIGKHDADALGHPSMATLKTSVFDVFDSSHY